jgi:hypothetical protein
MADPIWYVYGVVPSSFSLDGVPSGVEDALVLLLPGGESVAAAVSQLDRERYGPEALESSTADVQWIGTRAVAHDRVLTWMSDRAHGAVVPMPMLTIFSSADAVLEMLRSRSRELAAALARVANGREYALRVYRVDSELASKVGTVSTAIKELEESAAVASPGQRYLLQRKLEAERKTEARRVSQEVANEVFSSLSGVAAQSSRLPIAQQSGVKEESGGALVLNAAFLVATPDYASFQQTLSGLVARYATLGMRFDFTGPWPAYHFASP